MADNVPNVTQIPAPRVDFIDKRTGLMSREWYRFFVNIYNLTGGGTSQASIEDLQLTPNSNGTEDAVAEMQKAVENLQLLPQVYPDARHLNYASFYDTTTQTAPVINTAYPITFNSSLATFGIGIGTPTSRIVCYDGAVYEFQFTVQLHKTTGSVGNVYLWVRKNGTDVVATAVKVALQGATAEVTTSGSFMSAMAPNDYFELIWSADALNCQLLALPASSPVPSVASVILTVIQVSL